MANPFPPAVNPFRMPDDIPNQDFSVDTTDGQFEAAHGLIPFAIKSPPWMGPHSRISQVEWQSVERAQEIVKKSVEWANWRKDMRELVSHTRGITKAYCLGLGPWALDYPDNVYPRRVWIFQYAAFMEICVYIEENQGGTHIPRMFQEARYDLLDRYLYEKLGGNHFTVSPEAEEGVDEHTFFYAIHLDVIPQFKSILKDNRHPELYIGNRVDDRINGIGMCIARLYLEHLYLERRADATDEIRRLRRQAEIFHETHERVDFLVPYGVTESDFRDTYAYYRRTREGKEDEGGKSLNGHAEKNGDRPRKSKKFPHGLLGSRSASSSSTLSSIVSKFRSGSRGSKDPGSKADRILDVSKNGFAAEVIVAQRQSELWKEATIAASTIISSLLEQEGEDQTSKASTDSHPTAIHHGDKASGGDISPTDSAVGLGVVDTEATRAEGHMTSRSTDPIS